MFNGKTIRALRVSREWTQTELAARAQVQRRQISFYENGKAVPDLNTAHRLAAAFGVSIDHFFAPRVSQEKQDPTPAA